MGSKSSSSSANSQETTQLSSEGILTNSTVLQGENITVNENFGDNVSTAFDKLINLAQDSLNTTKDVGQIALDAVAERRNFEEQPVLTTQKASLPYIIGGVALVSFLFLVRN